MRDRLHRTRPTRSVRARLLTLAALMCGVSVAGCSGSSHHPKAPTVRSATTAVTGGATTAVTTVATGAVPPGAARSGAAVHCVLGGHCFSPQQFRVAYGIQPLLARRIDGRGETVTVLVPVPTSKQAPTDIREDLEGFDSMFRLPAARIEVVRALAGSASPWQAGGEEVTDTEFVHAVAPAATLRVVLFPSNWSQGPANATADMLAGLRLAVSHTDVASISWGLGEHYFTKAQVAQLHSILLGAAADHVTVTASSGDNGSFSDPWFGKKLVKELELPASDPLVLGVGGSALTASTKTGAYIRESAWPDAGGGFSHLYTRPAYQDGVRGISKWRGVPDVAGDAYFVGGMATLVAGTHGDQATLESNSGTSNSTPLWGGLIALADQYAHHDLGSVNPAIYSIARSASYHKAFHDITTGTNGYPAARGWDPVTGWGTPNAQVLIPLLARFTSRSNT